MNIRVSDIALAAVFFGIATSLFFYSSYLQNPTGFAVAYFDSGDTYLDSFSPTSFYEDDLEQTVNIELGGFIFGSSYAIVIKPPISYYEAILNSSLTSSEDDATAKCKFSTVPDPDQITCCIESINNSDFSLTFDLEQKETAGDRSEVWEVLVTENYTPVTGCSKSSGNVDPEPSTIASQTVTVLSSQPTVTNVAIICSDGESCTTVGKTEEFDVTASLADNHSTLDCTTEIAGTTISVEKEFTNIELTAQNLEVASNLGPLDAGSYTVTVTCADDSDNEASDSANFDSGNSPPTIDEVGVSPPSIYPDTKNIMCTHPAPTDPDGDEVTVSYVMKVGSKQINKGEFDCTKVKECVQGASISCTVTASDGLLQSSETSSGVEVKSHIVSVDLGDNKTVQQGEAIVFRATVNYTGSKTLHYKWNFGDGTISGAEVPTHAYDEEGQYTVNLDLDDKKGSTKSKTMTVYVNPAAMSLEIITPTKNQEVSRKQAMDIKVYLKDLQEQPIEDADVVAEINSEEIVLQETSDGTYEGSYTPPYAAQYDNALIVTADAVVSNTEVTSTSSRTVYFKKVDLTLEEEIMPEPPFYKGRQLSKFVMQFSYPDGSIVQELDGNDFSAQLVGEETIDLVAVVVGHIVEFPLDYTVTEEDSQNGQIAIKILHAADKVGNEFNAGSPKSFTYAVTAPPTELAIELISPNEAGELQNQGEVKIKITYADSGQDFGQQTINGKINEQEVAFTKQGDFYVASFALDEGEQDIAIELAAAGYAGSKTFARDVKLEQEELGFLFNAALLAVVAALVVLFFFIFRHYRAAGAGASQDEYDYMAKRARIKADFEKLKDEFKELAIKRDLYLQQLGDKDPLSGKLGYEYKKLHITEHEFKERYAETKQNLVIAKKQMQDKLKAADEKARELRELDAQHKTKTHQPKPRGEKPETVVTPKKTSIGVKEKTPAGLRKKIIEEEEKKASNGEY